MLTPTLITPFQEDIEKAVAQYLPIADIFYDFGLIILILGVLMFFTAAGGNWRMKSKSKQFALWGVIFVMIGAAFLKFKALLYYVV